MEPKKVFGYWIIVVSSAIFTIACIFITTLNIPEYIIAGLYVIFGVSNLAIYFFVKAWANMKPEEISTMDNELVSTIKKIVEGSNDE